MSKTPRRLTKADLDAKYEVFAQRLLGKRKPPSAGEVQRLIAEKKVTDSYNEKR